jgi:hypothetical protein
MRSIHRRALLKRAIAGLATPIAASSAASLLLPSAGRADVPSVDISSFGGAGDSVTDNTGPLNNAVQSAFSQGIRMITFGVGRFIFNSEPNPIQSGMWIVGANRPETTLVRNYTGNSTSLLTWEGGQVVGIAYGGAGGGIRNLQIVTADGTSGGLGVYLHPLQAAVPRANIFIIDNIEIFGEGSGTWSHPLYLDGRDVTDSAFGIRDIWVRSSVCMQGTVSGIFIANGVFCFLRDVGVFGGTSAGVADIYVQGITTTAPNTAEQIIISGSANGTLHLINCSSVVADGIFGSVSVSNASNCIVNGQRVA